MKTFKEFLSEEKIKELPPVSDDLVTPGTKLSKVWNNPHYEIIKYDEKSKTGYSVKMSGHQYVYHGTTERDAKNILKNGLTPKKQISFTGIPHEGAGYAHDRGHLDSGKSEDGMLLRIHKRHLKDGRVRLNDNGTHQNCIFNGNIHPDHIEIVGKVTRKK